MGNLYFKTISANFISHFLIWYLMLLSINLHYDLTSICAYHQIFSVLLSFVLVILFSLDTINIISHRLLIQDLLFNFRLFMDYLDFEIRFIHFFIAVKLVLFYLETLSFFSHLKFN